MAGTGDTVARSMGEVARHGPVTVCFPFVGDLAGGSHISACGLIRMLDPERFTALVLVQHKNGAIAKLFEAAGVEVEEAPSSAALMHGRPIGVIMTVQLIANSYSLSRYLRARNVAITHSNDGRTHATWGLAARLAGAKLLWHHRGSPDAIGLRLVAPLLANRVVAVSRFSSPRPGRYSAAKRAQVIHSPFETAQEHDRQAARRMVEEQLGVSPTTRFIAYSGALIGRKRPLLFVGAIAALRRMAPHLDVRGLVLGESLDGMEARVATHAEALGVTDIVHQMGFKTPGAYWLAACDILMVPAIDEPFGRTLIEAMLVGTPVVATASGGNIEAIRDGETGFLVRPEDPDALAAACLRLLSEPATWSGIGKAARCDALSRFGDARHATEVMAVYDDMLAASTGGRDVQSFL
jgi:glycosyltransferase involved in cell wall biosynthesis